MAGLRGFLYPLFPMTIRISHISLTLAEGEPLLKQKAADALRIRPEAIQQCKIYRKSLDARRKNRIHFVYTLDLSLPLDQESSILQTPPASIKVQAVFPRTSPPLGRVKKKWKDRPVVVGTGPAGLFAALKLAEGGCPPVVLERGKPIPQRVRDVENFWQKGILDEESNVQFGEGGAGTFSDGKIYSRIHDPRVNSILETFCRYGAPAEILYDQKPHIGTDRLRRLVSTMRRSLQSRGVTFRFQTQMTGLCISGGSLRSLILQDGEEVPTEILLLAPGHSARDTYRMLHQAGVALEAKPFAVGLRVEHTQARIDRIQYGPAAGHPRLPPADYRLTYRSSQDRAVYSFCMCPGGMVIGASSEAGRLVINGMSYFRRNSLFANSAIVVSVGPEDFGEDGPLAGMKYQEQWEEKAFHLGGGAFKAPAQSLMEFLERRSPARIRETSYRPGITPVRIEGCLPPAVAENLREAFPCLNRKMPGFSSREAMLIGVETRTSAPLRILRDENFQSVNVRGLYPCGEGSGYAGGIVSSALDGMKAAEAILRE
jgi:uncharacterized FAD-dependent dehydrogenase